MRNKLRSVWFILRGRPVIYRARFAETVTFESLEGGFIAECHFKGYPAMVFKDAPAVPQVVVVGSTQGGI